MQQQPTKKSSFATARPKQWSHLPEALRDNGPAFTVLKKAAEDPTTDQGLVKRLQEDLKKIRSHPTLNSPEAKESEEVKQQAYGRLLHDANAADRVFCFCLAAVAEIAVRPEFTKNAKAQYVQNRAGYDAILAD